MQSANEYQAHELEPKRFKTYEISSGVEDELLANRFFLKRRVWRNMNKIRRAYARVAVEEYEARSKRLRLQHRPLQSQ